MDNKYYLISGPIIALGLMLGTTIGAGMGNIKIGIAFGLLSGIAINALIVLLNVTKQKKK